MRLKCKIFLLFLLTGNALCVLAQDNGSVYSLKQKIEHFKQQQNYLTDTAYANTLIDLAYLYSGSYPDSALAILAGNIVRCHASGYKKGEVKTYIITGDAFQTKGIYKTALANFDTAYALAKKSDYNSVLSLILNRIGTIDLNQGNYAEALSKFYESLKAAEAIGNNDLTGATLNNIAVVQFYQGMFSEAEITYRQRLSIAQKTNDTSGMSVAYNGLGEINLQQKNPVQALHNLNIAYNLASKINDREMSLTAMLSLAETYYALDSLQKSLSLFQNALQLSKQTDHGTAICNALTGLAKIYYKQGLLKEALTNGLEGLQRAEKMGQVQLMRDANEIVSTVYAAMNDGNNALRYYKQYKLLSDSMNNLASQRAVATEKDKYEFSKKEGAFQRKNLQQQWLIFSAIGALVLLGIILWIITKNRNRLKNTYKELQQKNITIETQKQKAEGTLFELQTTQQQLIQAEKMASLGELTAGIAHEIQNPLNFVNNFSELNNELLQELIDEASKNNVEDVKALAHDIKANEEKINHHGKRADAIVKNMLQHSLRNTGQKEQVDFNKLVDEYLRLSYHGFRAKDYDIHINLITDFDDTVGDINIVPQDVGKALVNIFNNAFYEVSEKHKTAGENYKPVIIVTTKKVADAVEINISDNGNGIAQNIINKIFQPFFTTKPTGKGIGLGLSLAYDIIVKEYSGSITAKNVEAVNQATVFTIQLPLQVIQ